MSKRGVAAVPCPASPEFAIDLPYEIDMLRGTYGLLVAGQRDVVIRNALIESFAVHARNLVEFFMGKRNAMNATSFTEARYRPLNDASAHALYDRICKQVSHLKTGRPQDGAEKINATDPDIIRLLEQEIDRFTKGLRPEYRLAFKYNTQALKPLLGLAYSTTSFVCQTYSTEALGR